MIYEGKEALQTNIEYGKRLGVHEATIRRWSKSVDWDHVKNERRKQYAARLIPIDDAMFRAAVRGDVQAAKYIAERYDGYVPLIGQVQIKDADSDLLAEAARIKASLSGEVRPDQPGISKTATA